MVTQFGWDRWKGKRWATLGDSITAANGYQPKVQTALGFAHVANHGRSGCTMTAGGERDEGATVRVAQAMEETYDNVTMFAGTNDYRLSRPLGTVQRIGGPFDILTFRGAYQTAIEAVLGRNPRCRLNLWTPLQRDKDGYDTYARNDEGHRLEQYAEAVVELGRLYALPVLDLYASSGFNPLTLEYFTTDRLHPNEAGHERIAALAIPFLASI